MLTTYTKRVLTRMLREAHALPLLGTFIAWLLRLAGLCSLVPTPDRRVPPLDRDPAAILGPGSTCMVLVIMPTSSRVLAELRPACAPSRALLELEDDLKEAYEEALRTLLDGTCAGRGDAATCAACRRSLRGAAYTPLAVVGTRRGYAKTVMGAPFL